MATAQRLALGILQGRGGISLLGNEDELIFRGHVLTDQPELLVVLQTSPVRYSLRVAPSIKDVTFTIFNQVLNSAWDKDFVSEVLRPNSTKAFTIVRC